MAETRAAQTRHAWGMWSEKGKERQTRNEDKEAKAFRKVREKKEYLEGEKKRGKKENQIKGLSY